MKMSITEIKQVFFSQATSSTKVSKCNKTVIEFGVIAVFYQVLIL